MGLVWEACGAAEPEVELFAATTLVGLGADEGVVVVIGDTVVAVADAGADAGAGAKLENFPYNLEGT